MIKTVIIGVGNCASSFVQGLEHYKSNPKNGGMVTPVINGYSASTIEIVGAIDVDHRLVGKDVSEAIFSGSNSASKFCDVSPLGVKVVKGNVLDGVASHMSESFQVKESQESVNVADYMESVEAECAICYLPVGSEHAAKFYAEECLKTKVSFINAIPVFICSTPEWDEKFKSAGVPCAGDDIKSQFGATYLNRVLVESLVKRGFHIDDLYQLNVGGNTDFENMLDENRLESKRISKTKAVTSLYERNGKKIPALRIGPSDYVPHLGDTKICYINVNGTQFGDVPFELELKLKVQDSPNSAGIMIDVVRYVRVARDKGMSGTILAISAFGFKHPIQNFGEQEIIENLEQFLD
ncbi:MAG: inositol-3-phosphate synthase [Cytophagales bacterium]|nr:inositol-3-phosphate synthase [Cytophagales bacterium]